MTVERIALEPADVDKLAGEARSPYDVAIVVGAWCFLRPSELLVLDRSDVDQGAGGGVWDTCNFHRREFFNRGRCHRLDPFGRQTSVKTGVCATAS